MFRIVTNDLKGEKKSFLEDKGFSKGKKDERKMEKSSVLEKKTYLSYRYRYGIPSSNLGTCRDF